MKISLTVFAGNLGIKIDEECLNNLSFIGDVVSLTYSEVGLQRRVEHLDRESLLESYRSFFLLRERVDGIDYSIKSPKCFSQSVT